MFMFWKIKIQCIVNNENDNIDYLDLCFWVKIMDYIPYVVFHNAANIASALKSSMKKSNKNSNSTSSCHNNLTSMYANRKLSFIIFKFRSQSYKPASRASSWLAVHNSAHWYLHSTSCEAKYLYHFLWYVQNVYLQWELIAKPCNHHAKVLLKMKYNKQSCSNICNITALSYNGTLGKMKCWSYMPEYSTACR